MGVEEIMNIEDVEGLKKVIDAQKLIIKNQERIIANQDKIIKTDTSIAKGLKCLIKFYKRSIVQLINGEFKSESTRKKLLEMCERNDEGL